MEASKSKIDFNYVLNRYLPSQREREEKKEISSIIIRRIDDRLQQMEIEADSILVGSQSRGTELKNSDLDIFIRFSKKYSREEIEKIGLNIGFEIIPDGLAKYAEHPYVSGLVNGIKVDIVPCYKVEMNSGIISSVDRTPLHTIYMQKVMSEEMKREAVLLKLFMKRQGIYGSELKTSGFSGYVCELIILEFKSFQKFMEYISNLKGNLIIGREKLTSRFNSPVVIIDPVDEQRNAAAAVNETNLSVLKVASKFYINDPDIFFFTYDQEVNIDFNAIEESYIAILRFPRPDIIDDILAPQLELAKKSIVNLLISKGFHYINSHILLNSENMDILIELEDGKLKKFEKREGPPAENSNSISFINKYSNSKLRRRGPYIESGRIYFDIYREETEFKEILMNNIGKLNLGHNINKLKDSIEIMDVWEKIKDQKSYKEYMSYRRPILPAREDLNKS
ncbi:CCA tRNA nucleotidyltransferase [Cuniculiplasma sp. SKW3]|uniref:CCA tRNA nucleotidyltransferase n=1 Tax=unclassified Cuniculiplasma TaxID=2619706 RepID=UPI003FCF1DDE